MRDQTTPQLMAKRLIWLCEGQVAAAKACGLSQSTLSQIANAVTTDVKSSTIEKLKQGLAAKEPKPKSKKRKG
jgi:hypothetical protein